MKAIYGQKIGMTQVFDKDGKVVPVSVIRAFDLEIVRGKKEDADGYSAIQVGMGERKRIGKALAGQTGDKKFRHLREIRVAEKELDQLKQSAKIDLSIFDKGEKVKVIGVSKGRGFSGAIKRHNFAGGPKTHGHRHVLRSPGSAGSMFPQRVFKGLRRSGQYGNSQSTVLNLEVVDIDLDDKVIALKGAVPGPYGNLLRIEGEGAIEMKEEAKKGSAKKKDGVKEKDENRDKAKK